MTDSTEMVGSVEATDLTAAPIIDTIHAQRLALIKAQVAPRCNDAEVGHFLELCHHYGLDPFAREAWCAKSDKGDRLLIMVGRDGLRKIAQRQGIHVDGDVVREKDTLSIVRTPDGNRTVAHSYGNPAERGDIVGAWAECRKGGPTGVPLGYFYAPLTEYRPANVSSYSPWSKQIGVMILAAAERQAIRQATPLGGLLAVGEDEVVNDGGRDLTGIDAADDTPVTLEPAVEEVVARATALGHSTYADRAAAHMATAGQGEAMNQAWVAKAMGVLDAFEAAQEPEEAEVVLPSLEDQVSDLEYEIAKADEAANDELVGELVAERDLLRAEAAAQANPDQDTLI